MPDHLAPPDAETFADSVLREALELLPDAIVLFDADDRLALWNSRYSDIYSRKTPLARGMRFEEIMRIAVSDGLVPDAVGRPDAWIAARVERHRMPSSTYEHRLANGRWVRIQERRSADGWSIGVRNDITDLKQREESFRLLFEASPTPMYVADRATLGFVAVNAAALALYGYPRDRFLSMGLRDIRPEREHAAFDAIVASGALFDYAGERAWTHLRHDGAEITVVPHTKSLTLDGRPVLLSSIADITERQIAEAEAKCARAFLNSVVDLIPVGVFVKDLEDGGRYVIYNRCGETLVGRSRDEIVGRLDEDVFCAEDAARFASQDREVMLSRCLKTYAEETVTRGSGEVRTITTRKVPFLDGPDGRPRYLLGVSEDITERQRMASRLDHMAHHDALTGLPNRVVLDNRLDSLAFASRARPAADALLYIDLDGFKSVNDKLGHRIGDGLLGAVALRMRGIVEAPDLATRLGGDEFVLLVSLRSPMAIECGIIGVARHVVEVLSSPYDVDGNVVSITASIGIALAGGDDGEPETWLRKADVALYAAKRAGAGTVLLFSQDMDVEALQRREFAVDLERGIDAGEFELHYQPFVGVADERVVGHEALLRWRHPTRGLLLPRDFIPLAEDLGLVARLGARVVRQACQDAADWPADLSVAINLSPLQFRDDGLLATIASALGRSGLDPHRLEIEITEAVLIEDGARNIATLESLRRLGCRLVLDDFGAGLSSLSHLQEIRFDKIKIDGGCVGRLPDDLRSLSMLRAIVALATSLSIVTTAEGVETKDQHRCLRREGCVQAQGNLFGRPVLAAPVFQDRMHETVIAEQVA